MARTRDEVQADIDVLVNKLQAGEIDLAEYGQQLGTLMQQMNYLIYQETAMPIKTLEEQPEAKSLEAKKQITGMSPYSPIYKYGSQISQEAKREGEEISPEEAFARGKEKFEREILPSRFTTGEYEEVLPGYIGVSDVVDPVKGLIRDPKTGQVRKATQWELVKEIPFRQRKHTKSQEQAVQEKYEAAKREKSTLEKLGSVFQQEEIIPPPIETEFFGNIPSDEPATVVETPLATMLRAGLGTGSAVWAEGVQAVNDMIGWATGAPVSTRKEAGYKKTEADMVGGQMLTNALIGQGVWEQQQAQLLPPDTDYNGLLGFAEQGTLQSNLLGFVAEVAAPITPLGELANIPRLSIGTLLRKGAGTVLDAAKMKGVRSQIDTALKALDESKTVADLEKEIKKSGQTVTDNTLRAKKAEFAGDTYASSQAINEAIENATKRGANEITKADINTPDSLVVESMFGKNKSLTLDEVKGKADRLRRRLEETTGVGKRDSTILRNLKDTADEVRRVIQTGEAPKYNARLVNRAINTSKMMNFDVWAMAARGADDVTKNLLKEGRGLIIESRIKPLSSQQMIELGNIWKELDNKGVWNNIDENVFKTPRHIYTATRNAVAEVAKDNMLRHFTDDLIYVSPRVAVPVKNIQNTLGKKTTQFNAYQKQLGDLIDGRILDDGTRALNTKNARNILQYQRRSGLTLPQELEQKVLQTAEGNPVGLTQKEFQVLEQEISSELAMDYLGGVQLRSGGLTAMRAEAPLEARTELFASGKNVPSFVIGVKELDNAIRLATQDTAVGKAYLSMRKIFFPITDDLPSSYRKFQNEMLQAEQASVAQVSEALKRGADDPMHFDNVLTDYLRMDGELELQSIKETARTEQALGKVTPDTRQQFVGELDYNALYAPKLEDYIKGREQKLEDLVNVRMAKDLDKFESQVPKAIEKLDARFSKDLEKINKQYGRDILRSRARKQDLESRLGVQYANAYEKFEVNVQKSLDKFDERFSRELDNINKQYGRDILRSRARKEDFESRLGVQYANALDKFEVNVQKSTEALDKTFSRELDNINKQYGRDILRNRARRQDLKSRLNTQYANALDKFEAASNNARQVMQRKYDRQVEKLNKYFNRRYMELTLKQKNVVSDFKTKATQTTKRFKFAKQRKELQKEYEHFWDIIYNSRLNEEKWLENVISKKRDTFFNKLVNDSPEAIKNTNTKILDAIKQTDEIERRFDDAIRTHKIEYRESKKLLDEVINTERDRFFDELSNNVSDSLERTESKILDTTSRIDEIEKNFDDAIRKHNLEYIETKKFLLETINAERNRFFDELANNVPDVLEATESKILDTISRIEEIEKNFDLSINQEKNIYTETRKLLDETINAERDALFKEFENYATSEKFDKFHERTQNTLKNIQERIDTRIQKNQEQAVAKSEKAAAQRQTQILADKYGRDNISQFMQSQGIEATYENIVDNIAFIEENMDVAMRQIHLKNQWTTVVNDFFKTPVKSGDTVEFSLKRDWIDGLTDIIRKDKNAPFWTEDNIIPLTMDNYRTVIEELRNRNKALKGYGLREIKIRPGAERKEMFVLPLYKRMVDIQRKANMQSTIDDFLQNEPDLFVQLGRTSQQAVGLESTQAIADKLSTEILNITSRAVQQGFLTDDAVTVALHNVRETLFDGMMSDVWRMSDRGTQERFLQRYMRKMVADNTPVIDDMDGFVLDMYAAGVLQSNTFERVQAKVQKILDATNKNIQEIKTARELTKEEAKIVQQLENDLYAVTDMFKDQYLNSLTLRSDGVMDGLFTSQIRAVNDYMSRYGVTSESLVDSINRLAPRIDYMGNKNIALIYGIEHENNVRKILEMAKDTKTIRFLKDLQEAAATSYAGRYTGQYMLEVLSVMRRWAMGEMLGGIVIPSMRFIGMNAFTNPVIFMTTLPSNMRIKTLAGFTGHAVGSLAMQAPGVQRLTTKALEVPMIQNIFGKGTKSNRYKIAPDNEIIISRSEGAVRDYTAKELRDLSEYYGIESGYIDAQFQSAQFNQILIGAKKDASGFIRNEGFWNKLKDNLSPSGANYMTEYSRNQDAQMRRFVFIDSLMNGDTPGMAANKASRSILDYNLLKGAEATTVKKYMWFYSFMRTMGTAVINSVYTAIKTGKTSVPLKFLQMQDRLNRQTMRDYESAQNDTLGRVFGIYMDTVDGTDMYASGMMNPQTQMFDIMSTAGMYMLHAADKLNSDERTMEAKLYEASLIYADLPATGVAVGKKIAKGNPITELLLEMWDAENGRWKPMPSELVYAADEQGKLPELKKTYGLVERRRTPGRPLSREGIYYDFPKGEEGKRKVRLYLMHRLLGLTAANLIAYPMGYTAAQPRGIKEFWRGQMFAETDTMIPSPTGEGQIPIKDKTAYLKSLNKNNLNDMSSAWFMAYYIGLLTPTKTQSVQRQWEYGLKALERDIKAKE